MSENAGPDSVRHMRGRGRGRGRGVGRTTVRPAASLVLADGEQSQSQPGKLKRRRDVDDNGGASLDKDCSDAGRASSRVDDASDDR